MQAARVGMAWLLSLALASGASAHEPATPPATRVLGELSFPTTTESPDAQAAFTEGLLFLHVFEYASAAKAFQRAQQLDPGLAMAYWGEAMSFNHPVWGQQDLAAGRAVLAKLAATPQARVAKGGDARERAFLHSVETLYGTGDKRARDRALLGEMEAMARRWPQDDEVQLFLALALLGLDGGTRDVPRFLRAAEISKAVYRHNPKHPGAAHYWIHGMDDPQHAAGALEAANSLAKIAPDAGHSQHMTSHIFVALGRWQDVVDANEAAMRVVNADLAAKAQPAYHCGHYAEWLEYAWLQQGREDEAVALLGDCERSGIAAVAWLHAHPGGDYLAMGSASDLEGSYRTSLERMRAMALVDAPAHRRELLALPLETTVQAAGTRRRFAHGLAALAAGDLATAEPLVRNLQLSARAEGATRQDAIMAQMLLGALHARQGRLEEALELLRAAARDYEALPVDYGPPTTGKPPRELLGDVLLAAGRKEEARAEFAKALAAAPERKAALAGEAAAAP